MLCKFYNSQLLSPGRPRCQNGRVCLLRSIRLKNPLAFGTIADYQMAEDIGSQWGEGPSVLKQQFFPLRHVCIVLKDNVLLRYHAVDWGLFCTLSSAFHGPEMSAASVNFGQNSVLSQRVSEIMMSGITLLPHPYHICNFLFWFCLLFLFCFVSKNRVTPCSSDWAGPHSVDQAGL